jgi:predicted PolB exonuclease-like 3'-5' exonuclease
MVNVKRKRLFYDIETSFCKGHFWRPGYGQNILPHQITDYAKIISIHWKWEGQKRIKNLNWGLQKQCDKAVLEMFIEEMNKADEIITHNGKRFDTPWIRTRCMFHDIPMNHAYNEVDTYKLAKKYLNLPSYSLKEVCKYYNLPAKIDAGGMDTWVDVVYKKDKNALKHLLYYGNGDITSLEAVYNKFKSYVQHNMHYAVHYGTSYNKWNFPECGNSRMHRDKKYTTKMGTVRMSLRCSDKNCRTAHSVSNKTYQDMMDAQRNKPN